MLVFSNSKDVILVVWKKIQGTKGQALKIILGAIHYDHIYTSLKKSTQTNKHSLTRLYAVECYGAKCNGAQCGAVSSFSNSKNVIFVLRKKI